MPADAGIGAELAADQPASGPVSAPGSPVGANTPISLVYQPPSHFWPMQGIEAGIFVVLALALLVAALRFATRDA